jgi:hypothetical protein
VSDGVVRQGGRNELREPVELPAVHGHSYLYVDAVHGAADKPKKSKLSAERIGDGLWRLFFSDGNGAFGGMFRQPEYVVTVRFRKPEYYEHGGASAPKAAAGGGAGAATKPARASATIAPPEAPAWAAPNEPVVSGDFRVRLTSAVVEPPKPQEGAAPEDASQAPTIRLAFTVENSSTTRKLSFRRWRGDDFPNGGDQIHDNFGNTYKLIPPDPFAGADDANAAEAAAALPPAPLDPTVSLYPGKSTTVELTFEAPVENAEFLDVELPAKNVGGFKSVPLRFRVPRSAVHRALPPAP